MTSFALAWEQHHVPDRQLPPPPPPADGLEAGREVCFALCRTRAAVGVFIMGGEHWEEQPPGRQVQTTVRGVPSVQCQASKQKEEIGYEVRD